MKAKPFIIISLVCLMFFMPLCVILLSRRDRVEQEVFKDRSGECVYATWLWHDGHVIKGWFDNLDLTDSVKSARKKEAERILKVITNK